MQRETLSPSMAGAAMNSMPNPAFRDAADSAKQPLMVAGMQHSLQHHLSRPALSYKLPSQACAKAYHPYPLGKLLPSELRRMLTPT